MVVDNQNSNDNLETRQSSLTETMAQIDISNDSGALMMSNNGVSMDFLLESLIKLSILDYRMEPRFRQPTRAKSVTSSSPSSSVSSSPSSSTSSPLSHTDKSHHHHHRFNKLLHSSSSDYKLSIETLNKLKDILNAVAMKKNTNYHNASDDLTRRSLLRYYIELLEPSSSKDTIKNPEQLVVRFVACATKELNKVNTVPKDQMSNVIYKQTEAFISILIDIIKPEKHSDIMINKLQELQKSMRPSTYSLFQQQQQQQQQSVADVTYLKPSFKIADMTLSLYVGKIMDVDKLQLQQMITNCYTTTNETNLISELEKILIEYQQQSDSVKYQLEDFNKTTFYLNWKSGEERALKALIEKFKPLPNQQKQQQEQQISNIIPIDTRTYFIETAKLCLQYDFKNGSMLSNTSQELLELCCKIWRIDQFSKITWLYTAINDSILSVDSFDDEILINFFNLFQNYKLDQLTWPRQIQNEWINNLSNSYIQIMKEIRENLTRIFNETKPKFGSLLNALALVESDKLFITIKEQGIPQKWEKKLNKSLLKISEIRYVELLKQIPRDNSLNMLHVLNIANNIIDDAKLLTKRYPNPLLGFLQVPKICCGLSTAMFAADSKNMLYHILSYSQNVINYGDAMEIYKILCEIRSIFKQVNPPTKDFKFDLELFFYQFIDEWCDESGVIIIKFVNRALKEDNFKPVDLENDKLYSSSIIDIFAMINQSLNVLKNLEWENDYQYLKLMTKMLKYVSNAMIDYSNKIMELLLEDLDEQRDDIIEDQGLLNNTTEWLRTTVTGSINKTPPPPKPFGFQLRTCVGLNNLEALLTNLQKLEEITDPETLSSFINSKDPKAKLTSHLFSIRIVKSENLKKFNNSSRLPDTYVSLVDGQNKRRILKTRIIKNNLNPEWDEEFEFVIPAGAGGGISAMLGATVWDCSSRLGQQNVCGRVVINLNPKRFNMDGLPQDFELDLDTQGKLILQISMESERDDAVFSVGRAYRSITRVQERCVKLIVEKFLTFIEFSISRETLKLVCGNKQNSKFMAKNLLEPLFDYLNSNFQVLASNLTENLLQKVILQTWIIVLNTADNLLLPKLSSLKSSVTINALKSHHHHKKSSSSSTTTTSSSSTWHSAVTNLVVNVTGGNSIPGFGKPLTLQEVEVLFEWLKVLCFEFFHNNGAGPPIEELKNEHYQELLLVPVYYDHDVNDLKLEVDRFSPATLKLIRERHFFTIGNERSNDKKKKLTRAGTMARKKTIMASGSAKQRALAAQEYKEARSDPVLAQLSLENLVLKLLLLKGEHDFVSLRLEQRERLSKSIAAEFFARLAAEGTL